MTHFSCLILLDSLPSQDFFFLKGTGLEKKIAHGETTYLSFFPTIYLLLYDFVYF